MIKEADEQIRGFRDSKRVRVLALLALLAASFPTAYAAYLPLRSDMVEGKPHLQILQQTDNEILLEIKLPGVERGSATLAGRHWDIVVIPGGGFANDPGTPDVPSFSRLLAIPPRSGVQAELEVLESTTLDNIELMPAQEVDSANFVASSGPMQFDDAAYSQDRFYPQESLTLGDPALLRGWRVVALQTNPVSYNPVSKQLRIAHRYRVRVQFQGTDLRNSPDHPTRPVSHAWAKLMRSMVANFDELDVTEIPFGSYLIVCENNSALMDTLIAPLVEWKRRLGHTVVVQTFPPGASNTTIKAVIQNAYDTWAVPPEYVLLFGDVSGSYALPGWFVYGFGMDDQIDHPYSQLEGDDILADVALGRLPAGNSTEASTMVNKTIWYERTPYVDNTDWYHKGVLIAGVDSINNSGISSIEVNHWIKTRMIQNFYTQIDTFWYTMPGSVNSTLTPAINNGVCVANYRGIEGMGDFTINSIDSLINGRKLPFVVAITCLTGGFYGMQESPMERFVSTGTPSLARGAVACLGTATNSTHTRQNNTMDYGAFAGLYDEEITQAGNVLNRAKMELYNTYQTHDPQSVIDFSNFAALAGDPGVELYTGAIHFMTSNLTDNINYGMPLSLTISQSGVGPLPGAIVCLYKADELQNIGETNASGQVTLSLGSVATGNVKVTVWKHNFYPLIDSINVASSGVLVNILSNSVSDDSLGDGDGFINPGERVEILSIFKNYGNSTTATMITATASTLDNLITLNNSSITFPDLAPGSTANSLGNFVLTVSPNAPNGHTIRLNLITTANQGSWEGILDLPVKSYEMAVLSAQAAGSDTLLSPGETANFVLTVRNNGLKTALNLAATITALDTTVSVNDISASFGTVNMGAQATCNANPFNLTAMPDIIPGIPAHLLVQFTGNDGAMQQDTITICLGARASSDPQGPDEYGYYCYDNTDTGYAHAPTYDWIEIDPNYGGSGIQLNINGPGGTQNASINRVLPFTFRYYGENTSLITVCRNGWISTHANIAFTDFRNYPIPSAPGPYGLIAPFWDHLSTTVSGHVYYWFDEANHRFIVEWSHLETFGTPVVTETFEVILFDPQFYPTQSGNGKLLFQYAEITEAYGDSTDNPYSTVGIESPDHTDGLEVTYWNTPHDAAAMPVANGRAFLFTTDANPPLLAAPPVSQMSVPDLYSLGQNYPNPFNPTTTIRFGLPKASRVQLEVFDITGCRVWGGPTSTLEYSAGYHEIIFDGSNLASGIYLCRLTAGEFSASKKLVLLK